jgi:hypothetical protein
MKLLLGATLLVTLPVSAAPKVCATHDVKTYEHDQFGDVDRAKFRVDHHTYCVRVADDQKTASASMQFSAKDEPKVYPDLPWNPKARRWERWFQATMGIYSLGRYLVVVEDKGDHFALTLSGEGPDGTTTYVDVPKR